MGTSRSSTSFLSQLPRHFSHSLVLEGACSSTAMPAPVTLDRSISPPPTRRASGTQKKPEIDPEQTHDPAGPTLAAVEAGQAQIRDHLAYFASHLSNAIRPGAQPSVSIEDFKALYQGNEHRHGNHFVVHQHDHPISGIHPAGNSSLEKVG